MITTCTNDAIDDHLCYSFLFHLSDRFPSLNHNYKEIITWSCYYFAILTPQSKEFKIVLHGTETRRCPDDGKSANESASEQWSIHSCPTTPNFSSHLWIDIPDDVPSFLC